MDILKRIGRILVESPKDDMQDEYDELREKYQAAKKAGKKKEAEVIKDKMDKLRVHIVTYKE